MKIEQLADEFTKVFGGSGYRTFFAPGRINLIGEHTDYNGGMFFLVRLHLVRMHWQAKELIGKSACIL